MTDYVKANAVICTNSTRTNPVYVVVEISNLNIKMVENYGQTGTVTVYNNVETPTENLLSDQCTLWSDGQARKLDGNMFIRIFTEDYPTKDTSLGVFKITTMTVSDDLITVEFCDSLQLLRSQGADYVYNHFNGGYSWHNSYLRWDSVQNKAYVEKDAYQPLIGGDDNDVHVYYGADDGVVGESGDVTLNDGGDGISCFIPRSAYNGDYVYGVSDIWIGGGPLVITEGTYRIKIGKERLGSEIINDEFRARADFHKSETFAQPEYLPNGFWINIWTNHAWPVWARYGHCDGAWLEGISSNNAFTIKIHSQKLYKKVIGSEDPSEPTHWLVSTIGDETPVQGKIKSFYGSAQIYCAETTGPMKNTEIMDWIIRAAEMQSDIPTTCPHDDVWVFRCNGDYFHNYLLALADFPSNDTETQLSMFADNMDWGKISIRGRFRTDNESTADAPLKSLAYSRDAESGDQVYMSFNPSLSLKNRPSVAVVKSSDESECPIMVAVPDLNVPVGASAPIVSSHSTLTIDAAVEAYSQIMTNRSRNWSGEVKLSGIHMDYFKTDGTGNCGGIPLTITDHRYGFSDLLARVKEVSWDYANQTTTLTMNNYSEMYSNGLIDTSKMAYVAGGLSSEASNKDMFVRQFISIRSEDAMPETVTSVTIASKSAEIFTLTGDTITAVKFPELGVGVVNAYFPAHSGSTDERHGIHRIRVNNGNYITIPEAKRPDKSESQSLIVNVIYRLS